MEEHLQPMDSCMFFTSFNDDYIDEEICEDDLVLHKIMHSDDRLPSLKSQLVITGKKFRSIKSSKNVRMSKGDWGDQLSTCYSV